jgi:hypothetical protein
VAHRGRCSVALLTLLGFFACERAPEVTTRFAGGGTSPPRVVTEHRFATAELAAGTKQPGEDCAVEGGPGCASGVCLHTAHQPGLGYVCSAHCTGLAECPTGWRCLQAYPSAEGKLCVPPNPPSLEPVPDDGPAPPVPEEPLPTEVREP